MRIRQILTYGILFGLAVAPLAAQKLKPEDLIAKHLAALGAPDARAAKSRLAQGEVMMRVVVGGQANLAGTTEVASAGNDVVVGMEFGHANYQRERFVYHDGSVEVAQVNPGRRSGLGEFIITKDQVVTEGLLGGVLSTAWPLLDVAARSPKLKYDGLKKVDGKPLHQLSYKPQKRGGELDIKLYFDPATFQHVKTVYYFTIRAALGGASGPSSQSPAGGRAGAGEVSGTVPGQGDSAELATARAQENRYRLEEDFSEFHTVDGLNLPTHWKLRLTMDQQSSQVWEWETQFNQIKNNAQVDSAEFTIKQ